MTDSHEIVSAAPLARLHPMVAAALAASPDVETIRDLVELQRDWQQDEARREATAAMVRLKASLPSVLRRDRTVSFPGVHYTHTSLAELVGVVTPILAEHGFSLAWTPATEDRLVTVTARLTHRSGHEQVCTLSAPPDVSGKKSPAQGVASTVTLLSRYTAMSLLGLATADMMEPTGEPAVDPDAVDPARNRRAVAAIRRAGRTVEAAEELVQRGAEKWTATDLDTIRAWLVAPESPEVAPPGD